MPPSTLQWPYLKACLLQNIRALSRAVFQNLGEFNFSKGLIEAAIKDHKK